MRGNLESLDGLPSLLDATASDDLLFRFIPSVEAGWTGVAFLESSDVLCLMAGTEADYSEVSTPGAGGTGLVSFGDPVLIFIGRGRHGGVLRGVFELAHPSQTPFVLYPMCGISNLSGDVTN